MSVKNYKGSKFNGLRDKERGSSLKKPKSYRPSRVVIKTSSKKYVAPYIPGIKKYSIEQMSIDNAVSGDIEASTRNGNLKIGGFKMGSSSLCKCGSKEFKKVYYTTTKAYKMCLGCKADLGDAE